MPRSARRNEVRPSHTHRHESHSKGQCLKIFRRLSLYLDGELPDNACEEIRKHLHGCDDCEVFLASFKRTVTLCRAYPAPRLPLATKAVLRAAILKVAGRSAR